MSESRIEELIQKHLLDALTAEEFSELDDFLKRDDAVEERRRLRLALRADSYLAEAAMEPEPPAKANPNRWFVWALAAAAAVLVLVLGVMSLASRGTEAVATLVSNENASWESSLPTTSGSELPPGVMHLKAGMATIRFRFGAEVTLEAPARLELKTPMRARLLAGSAAVEVPESAIGFVLETPDGHAVDHGTAFVVSIDLATRQSSFEVLDGEISVHSSGGSRSLRLVSREAASISGGAVEKLATPPSEGLLEHPDEAIRIGTRGRTTTILREGVEGTPNELHPDFLMTKLPSSGPKWERRSLLSFDVSGVDWASVQKAGLWLNLVSTGMGHAAHLPRENRFSIYGVTNEDAEKWRQDVSWDEAPALENADLLGSFEIPRSVQTGIFRVESSELLEFLRTDANGSVTLIIIRDTAEVKSGGLVHAFASDTHPSGSGPVLRLTISNSR